MSTVMILEEFLFLALALVYIAISYGHSPGDSSAGRQSDMDQENLQGRATPGGNFLSDTDAATKLYGGKSTWRRN
jgi:hypothetical protein